MMRTYTFKPYRGNHRPHFILSTWDANRRGPDGKHAIRYRLTEIQPGLTVCGDRIPRARTVIFEGDDFYCSPLHAIDSVGAAHGLIGFLTLRPGDTDADYFDNYTARQKEFASEHAESLACEVSGRWEDENGNLKTRYR